MIRRRRKCSGMGMCWKCRSMGERSTTSPIQQWAGRCVSGCYTGEIDGTANNPLAGRFAWCGNSGGYINTVINLPASLAGQTIKLRFRMGTDEAVARAGSARGWTLYHQRLLSSVRPETSLTDPF